MKGYPSWPLPPDLVVSLVCWIVKIVFEVVPNELRARAMDNTLNNTM